MLHLRVSRDAAAERLPVQILYLQRAVRQLILALKLS